MAKGTGTVLLGLSLGLLLSGSVVAQETTEVVLRADSTAGFSGAGEEGVAGLKSGTTAFLWSFLGTAVPAVAGAYDVYRAGSSDSVVPGIVLVGGLVIGPSLGHFYSGRPSRALVGIGVRTLAGAGIALAALEALGGGGDENLERLAVAGAVLGGASLAWDIFRAPHSARVHNDQVREGRTAVGIAPTIGAAGFGLSVQVSF